MVDDISWLKPLKESLFLESPLWDRLTRGNFELLKANAPVLPDHFWIASSGSSSVDSLKLVALSRSALLSSANAVNEHLQVIQSDRWLKVLPGYHVGGLGIYVRAELAGCQVFELPNWDPHVCLNTIIDRQITLSAMVPTQIFDLVQIGARCPDGLRAIVIGGAALSPELYWQARDLGWPLLPSFGMTEVGSQIATASLNSLSSAGIADEKSDSPNKVKPAPSMKILNHVQCQVDENDALWVKGSSLLSGTLTLQNGTAVWLEHKVENWFQTSDRVAINGNNLEALGRQDEVIKILGEQVNLQKLRLEWQDFLNLNLAQSQGFEKSVFLDVPDERAGRKIVMVFEGPLSLSVRAQDLLAQFNVMRTGVERVAKVIAVNHIPRGQLNKPKWNELRQLVE